MFSKSQWRKRSSKCLSCAEFSTAAPAAAAAAAAVVAATDHVRLSAKHTSNEKQNRKRKRREEDAIDSRSSKTPNSKQASPRKQKGERSRCSISSARRKLLDKCMSTFLVGNTKATSLLSQEDVVALRSSLAAEINGKKRNNSQPITSRFLFIGVGDIRNALTTLHTMSPLHSQQHVELVLNDMSPVTLARDVVLLDLATRHIDTASNSSCEDHDGLSSESIATNNALAIEAAIAVWSDAVLTPAVASRLQLTLLALASGHLPSWMHIDDDGCNGDAAGLKCMQHIWNDWLSLLTKASNHASISREDYVKLRAETLAIKGTGHGRAGVSASWKKYGLSSCAALDDEESKEGCEQAHGKSRCAAFNIRTEINPTLLRVVHERNKEGIQRFEFLETQGTMGAFSDLEGLYPGSEAFARVLSTKCWGPLFKTLQSCIADPVRAVSSTNSTALSVRFWLGDCLVRLNDLNQNTLQFDAVDTSNVMDYAGLWNLIVAVMPRLNQSFVGKSNLTDNLAEPKAFVPFLQTESILSMATCLEHLLYEELPYQPGMHRQLLQLMGWSCSEVDSKLCDRETSLNDKSLSSESRSEEKVVRVRWFSKTNGDDSKEMEEDEKEFSDRVHTLLSDFFCLIGNPVPMTAHMLTSVHIPIEESYAWPKLTVATFVAYLSLLQQREGSLLKTISVQSYLVALFSDESVCTSPYARNRLLGLRIQLGLAVQRGRILLTQDNMIDSLERQRMQHDSAEQNLNHAKKKARKELNLHRLLFSGNRHSVSNEPSTWFRSARVEITLDDPLAPRGGVFEPALAAVLVRDVSTARGMIKRSGSWVKETGILDAVPINLLHEWIGKRSGASLQFIQNVQFSPETNSIGLHLPNYWASDMPSESGTASSKGSAAVAGVVMGRVLHPDASNFKYLILLDVQACTVISRPIKMKRDLIDGSKR